MTQAQVAYWVCADGDTTDTVLQLAERQGWEVHVAPMFAPFDQLIPRQDRTNTIVKLCEPVSLSQILTLPIAACVEVGTEQFLHGGTVELAIVLTTATAFSADVASIFIDALIGRGLIGQERRDDLRLALNEALANGLVHGNLEILYEPDMTPTAFMEHATLLETRLTLPDFGQRPVELRANRGAQQLEVTVRDSGKGFVPSSLPTVAKRLSGRGLALMAQHSDGITHTDSGRQVTLSYRLDHGAVSHG